jgi:predicted TIM-barrel fold metal-dependent hydrolase
LPPNADIAEIPPSVENGVSRVAEPEARVRRERLEDMLIIDCDVHVHESPAALLDYCDLPWSKALEAIKDVPERYLDIPGFSPGESAGGYQAKFPSGHQFVRLVETPAAMRAELSRLHVNIAVLFPDHLLKLPVLTQSEYAAALARAYNAWIADVWCDVEQGLLGCVVACPQDPDDAAAQIERYAGQPAVVGVYLPCAGIDPLWGNRKYNPIFRAAEECGLPVLLHSVNVTHPVYPFNNHGFDNELARHALSHPFSIMANLTSMVTTGVPVRYPNLRVASCEAGITWVPFLMNRLDKEYIEKRRDVPFLTERPSHYLRRYFYSTQPIEEPESLRDLALIMDTYGGADNTVFASDWPHHDFDHPMKVGQIPVSDEVRRKIFAENAMRLFQIDEHARRRT